MKVRRRVSEKALQANRANAKRSTGPKTPAGKAAVRRSPLKHGMRSQTPNVLPSEWVEGFTDMLMSIEKSAEPETVEEMVQNGWNLLEHGMLWKEVVQRAADPKSFAKRAEELVTQLPKAAKPKNALEGLGLLLDRIASTYLRKVMLLEEDAVYRSYRRANARSENKGRPSEEIARAELVVSLPSTVDALYEGMMKYESALDRGFHRDAFLLLQLQQLPEAGTPLPSDKHADKHARNGGKAIEGVVEKSATV